MGSRIPTIALITLLGFAIGCSGGGGVVNGGSNEDGPKLIVSIISGYATIPETCSADYSITAVGDTGITYLWAVDPPDSGVLSPQNTRTTNFTASEVDTDTPAEITVVVNSDNDGPIIKSIEITIEDSTPQDDPDPELEVGEIIGPLSEDEYSSWTYSVAASGDSGIAYEWSNDPLDIGNFENPNIAEPLYSTYGVGVDTDVEIIVTVNSDNFGPVIRSMTTTVLDSINPTQYLGGGHPIEGVNYFRNNRSPYPMPSDLAPGDFIAGSYQGGPYGERRTFRDFLISEDERLYISRDYDKNIRSGYNLIHESYSYTVSGYFGVYFGKAVHSGYGMVLTDSGLYSIIRSKYSISEDYHEPSGRGDRESGLDKYGAWPILEQHISAEWHYHFYSYFNPSYTGELGGMHIFDVFPLPDGSTLVAFARSGTYFQDPPTYIASLDGSFNTVYETNLETEIFGISFDETTGHIYISTNSGLQCFDMNQNLLWVTTSALISFSSTFAVITDDGGAIGVSNEQLIRAEQDGSIGNVVVCGPYLRPAITNDGSVAVITADSLRIYDPNLNFITEFPLPTGPGTGEIYTKTPLIGSEGNIALTTETDLYILNGSGTEIAHRTFDTKIQGLRLGPEHLFVVTLDKIYRFAH